MGEGSGCNLNVSWVIGVEEIYLGCIQDIDLILTDVSLIPLESVWQFSICEYTGLHCFFQWDCDSDWAMSGGVKVVPWQFIDIEDVIWSP